MSDFWFQLSAAERVYAVCALAGGILFAIRTLLTLVSGFGHVVDMDITGGHFDVPAGHADLPGGHAPDTSGEADTSFRALSVQGITAFFMMFGLVGLALSRQNGTGVMTSALGGLVAGSATVWIIGKMFVSMQKLQSDGTLHWERAIGQEGLVYLTIPADGKGQVSISVQQQWRICEAVSAEKVSIPTGERVIVVDVVNENVLVVSRQAS